MPNLKAIAWKISYGPQDDRLRDFFIPALAASVRYDRAAGYFSSTMLAVAAAGVTKLILNGGKMRLCAGPTCPRPTWRPSARAMPCWRNVWPNG